MSLYNVCKHISWSLPPKATQHLALDDDSVASGNEGALIGPSPAPTLPTEVWLLVLAWSGLRTSAITAAACSTFRDLHRTVASTPVLLARALIADHGVERAAGQLYGGPSGEPSSRHAVHTDNGITATIHEMLTIADPSHSAAAFAAATTLAPDTRTLDAASWLSGTAGIPAPPDFQISFDLSTPRAAAAVSFECTWDAVSPGQVCTPAHTTSAGAARAAGSWTACMSPVVTPHASSLLRAAASAGHTRVAVAAMRLGARLLDGALVGASGCGRERVVRLLLASGANPDASEPFGPCALFEAARNGHTQVVEVLLEAGADIDGATDQPMRHGGMRHAPLGYPVVTPHRWAGAPGPSNAAGGRSLLANMVQPAVRAPAAAIPAAVSAALVAATVGASVPSICTSIAQNRGAISRKRPWSSDTSDLDSDNDGAVGTRPASGARPDKPQTPPPVPHPLSQAHSGMPELRLGSGRATAGAGGSSSSRPVLQLPPPLRRRPHPMPLQQPLPRMPQLSSVGSPLPPLPALRVPALASPPMLLLWPSQRNRATPLLAACQGGHAATVSLLLRRGARVDMDRGSELMLAGHPDIVNELLAAAPGLSAHLAAALVAAASGNRVAVLTALLQHGANPCDNKAMALHEAAYQGHVAAVEALLEAGGAELRNSGAVTAAFRLAQRWGRAQVAQVLMTAAAA